jgi:hypothetical protein
MSSEHWFEYHGERLDVFYHLYNLTHLNERMIEIAIAHRFLHQRAWSMGLEVGNVLGHYGPMSHVVIDLHEQAEWYQSRQTIVNTDILGDLPPKMYPWVISISTIEHTADPVAAIDVLRSLVAPGGSLLVTFPTGEREELDDLAVWCDQTFDRWCTIVRTENDHGGWEQTPSVEIRSYGPWANSVFIGEWTAPA